jgi:hypothetical protein
MNDCDVTVKGRGAAAGSLAVTSLSLPGPH